MPRGKGRGASRSSQVHFLESDDDEPYAPSQATTQSQKALASYTEDEVKAKVDDLVQYLLIADQRKYPIKKNEINNHVLKEARRGFDIIFEIAKNQLEKVFGILVKEIEGKQKQKQYILVNQYQTDHERSHLQWIPEDNTRTGLLMIILGLIFMNNNLIEEALLWHILQKLGIDKDKPHDVFGDIKKLMSEYQRQGYLEYIKQPQTSDPIKYEVKWGPRAHAETSKRHVLEFVSSIYGGGEDTIDPKQWPQWQEVEREEQERTAAAN